MQRYISTAGVLFFLLAFFARVGHADVRTNASAWIDAFGLTASDSVLAGRVQRIFSNIKEVTSGSSHHSQLYIVDSDTSPWAIALQDKNIILSRGAIDVVYSGDDSLIAKDARMAFILGHELKHVITDDFWHDVVYRTFSNDGFRALDQQALARRKQDELRADEDGFIYAALAGYDMTEIFNGVGRQDSFLEYWVKQTNTFAGPTHFTAPQRIQFLHNRFKSLHNSTEFFKFGVRLAHFGYYREAQILLQEFSKVFESAQVLNNLGYVHIQLARNSMPSSLAYRFWLPTLLESGDGLPGSTHRNLEASPSRESVAHLRRAVSLLQEALDKTNPESFDENLEYTIRLNLITALFYLQKYDAARAVLVEFDGWKSRPQMIGMDALIVMHDDRIKDPWDTCPISALEDHIASGTAAPNLIYNYARLLNDYRSPATASAYWHYLHGIPEYVVTDYQAMICRELRDNTSCVDNIKLSADSSGSWKPLLKPGDDIDSPDSRRMLKGWDDPLEETLDGIDAKIFTDPAGNTYLALDGVIVLASIRRHGFDFVEHLLDKLGEPAQKTSQFAEEIWSYHPKMSVLVDGNQVNEIWLSR